MTQCKLFEPVLADKIKVSIERLKMYEPAEGYYLAFSGGKDSIVLKELTDMSGVKYDGHYSNPTIDPPELIYFIRKHHPDIKIHRPPVSFLKELVSRGFPMRQSRWCCQVYKEGGGEGRFVLTGIRKKESFRRSKRQMVETYQRKGKKMVEACIQGRSKRFLHPMIDWTEDDVWQFIRGKEMPYCKLYDEGWKRIGCIFCPMAGRKERERMIKLYPRHKRAFIWAFNNLYKDRKSRGMPSVNRWKNGEEMFWWWIGGVK